MIIIDHLSTVLKGLYWLPEKTTDVSRGLDTPALAKRRLFSQATLTGYVRDRVIYNILLLVFKALNGAAPYYIKTLLQYRTFSRTVTSSSQRLLVTPTTRLITYGERPFVVAARRCWNTLPLDD